MKIGIIGAGPAGIMAAYGIQGNHEIFLFEKNEKIGKKLFITGKGRCNITNNRDISEFFDEINRNASFLYSSFYRFTNRNIVELLKEFGLETKVERGERIFPVSDKSGDVLKAFQRMLEKKKVKIKLKEEVFKITRTNLGFSLKTNKTEYDLDKIIIATGGLSYPKTGSTGFGFKLGKEWGINIIHPLPALVPVEIEEPNIRELMGLSLKNVQLTLSQKKKPLKSEFGEMLFTHFGISGPIVLTLSHFVEKNKNQMISLDLKPALDEQQLDRRILRDFNMESNKAIHNVLEHLLPKKIIPFVLREASIEEDKKAHQITKDERIRLRRSIKDMRWKIRGLRPIEEAIITKGGIDVNCLDPTTMESLKIPGLYFAGEVIDVDANTGGYNLQIAYSTGYLAGLSASENNK